MGRRQGLSGRASAAAIALMPAALLLCFTVAWWLFGGAARLPRPFGEPSDAAGLVAPADVPGFEGSVALERGRLTARLMPLQALPEWQAFDAAALQRRLALAPGEPWRLALTYEPQESGAAELALDADALRILDADGGARLAPLAPAPEPRPDAPADPLRTLLGAHPRALAAGAPVEIVLWGRAPDGAPRLALGDHEIALAPVRVKAQEIERSIARLEPPRPAEAGGEAR